MNRIFLSLILSFFYLSSLSGQVVTTDPIIPIETEAVKIIFNASLGTGGLMGYSGDIYAHTGVITDKSTSGSDWKYVKTSWGENTDDTKLTRIDTDLYELEITPSIRDYYGVPSSEKILQMAFVFRSEDSSKEGKGDGGTDIFVDIYEDVFVVQIDNPLNNSILDEGTTIEIQATATEECNLSLFVNDELLQEEIASSIEESYLLSIKGDYWIVVEADNGNDVIRDTVFVCVKEDVILETIPGDFRRGVNYLDDESVLIVLWAPYKSNVFLLGDFNDWRPGNDYQMKKDGDYYWLQLDGLTKGKDYVYQFLIDGKLLLADPYTDQVSDPNNDKHISEETYPGLVRYPFQKTNGMAAVFRTGQSPYNWEVTDFQPVEKEKMVIYELLIRDFHEDHSYLAVIDKLDYLQDLGVNVLELMPVNEFEGNESWGYNPSFYFAPDKYYGHKNDLKKLVDECHKRGIAVLIDMVLNHSYGQSPFAQMYLDGGKPSDLNPWYNREHNFSNTGLQWGYDFDHESPHTQELVDSINSYWLTEYNVDGFRFDFTKGIGNNYKGGSDPWGSNYDADRVRLLKRMADEIWERKPSAVVCFEHLSDNVEERELANYGIFLWGNINHDYAESAMGYNSNFNWGQYQSRGWDEANLISYMESHDEERIMYKISQWGNSSGSYSTKDPTIATHRIGANSVFFLPLPGPKMIWQFGEIGYDISIDYDCRVCNKPILWEYFDDPDRRNIYNIMSNMSYLKSTYEIFSSDDFEFELNRRLKQYQLHQGGEYVIAVGNFGVEADVISVDFPVSGSWNRYFTQTEEMIEAGTKEIVLNPGEYHMYSTIKMDWKTDMDPYSFLAPEPEDPEFVISPNPSSHTIDFGLTLTSVKVYDICGKLVVDLEGTAISGLDIALLERGCYVLRGIDEEGNSYTSKFIKG